MYKLDTPEKRRSRWLNRIRFIAFAIITMILIGLVQQPSPIPMALLVVLIVVFAGLAFNEVRLMYNDLMETAVRRQVVERRVQAAIEEKSKPKAKRRDAGTRKRKSSQR